MEMIEIGFILSAILIAYLLSVNVLKQRTLFPLFALFLIFIMSETDVIDDSYALILFIIFPILFAYLLKQDKNLNT